MARKLRRCRARSSMHGRVVGRPLGAAVPRPVVVAAVGAVLAVGLVVLAVVGDQVGEREAVVAGDEVDRGDRPAPAGLVQVAGAGQPGGELGQGRRAGPRQKSRTVSRYLPFHSDPQRREVAHLVAALADVPRLGDQLDLGDHRVLLDQVEEGGQPVHVVQFPGQRRREVEPEPVDVHLQHPVPQRVHDQLERVRVPHVEAVPAPGVVDVVAPVRRRRAGSRRRCRCRGTTASGPGGRPRRCGCRPRRG